MTSVRLRHLAKVGPRPALAHLNAEDAEVTFAPMDTLADGPGGLDTSQTRPVSEVSSGSYNFFADGDLLLAKVTPCFENGKKALAKGLVNGVGFATSEVHVIRPNTHRIDPRYLFYVLSSEDFRAAGMASMTGAGGLRRVAESAVLNYRPRISDLPTQKAISAFLDREIASIDQLIEKKATFIATLLERESGLVRRLLSGGKSQHTKQKAAAAPWLQSVPEDWDVVPLRYLVKISTGGRDTQDRTDGGQYPFYVRSMNVERIDSYSYDEEAVLTSGDGAGVGRVFHYVTGKFELHQRMYAFTKFKRLSGRYFFHFMKTFFHLQMTQWSAKSTVDSVRMPFLKSMLFAIPPWTEQEAILKEIDANLHRTSNLIETMDKSIQKLHELRAALITAAVSGQIDLATWRKRGATDRRLDEIREAMHA